MSLKVDIPQRQIALILQGEGALGAYEAGVVSVLCEYLIDEDKVNNNTDKKMDHYLILLLVHR